MKLIACANNAGVIGSLNRTIEELKCGVAVNKSYPMPRLNRTEQLLFCTYFLPRSSSMALFGDFRAPDKTPSKEGSAIENQITPIENLWMLPQTAQKIFEL